MFGEGLLLYPEGLTRSGSVVPLLERLESLNFSFCISFRLWYMKKKWKNEV